MQKASTTNVNIENIKTLSRGSFMNYQIDIWVQNVTHLNTFMKVLNNLGFVDTVERWIV